MESYSKSRNNYNSGLESPGIRSEFSSPIPNHKTPDYDNDQANNIDDLKAGTANIQVQKILRIITTRLL